jgi:hypothetical protein
MNIYVMSGAVAVAFAAAGILLAKSTQTDAMSRTPPAFTRPCEQVLSAAAAWAVGEAKRLGKDVSLFKGLYINLKVPSICGCAGNRLASELEGDQWPLAGKLTGIQYKTELAMLAKDQEVKLRAREAAQGELRELMAEHQVSQAEVGKLSRKIDTAMKSCIPR